MISNESSDPAISRLNWESLHGVTLDGGYELTEISQADDKRASFRVRVLGDAHCKASADFYLPKPSVAREQLALWTRAKRLNHPNLAAPLDSGVYHLDSNELIYVVTRAPDERLDRIILERALEPPEAKELLQVLKTALTHLHAEGLVHGCVSPEHVFAFGETIRLSTLPVRPINSAISFEKDPPRYLAPESTDKNVTPSADVWCLGATLFEALTQRRYSTELYEDTKNLPDLVRVFITHCLDPNPVNRPRLDTAFVPAAKPVPPRAPVSASPVSQPDRTERLQQPVVPTAAANKAAGKRIWAYAIAGLAVILLLIWVARPHHTSKPASVPAPAATASRSTASAWPTRTVGDTDTSDAARRSKAQPVKPSALAGSPAVWRVVLYTFARQEDAEKRAHALNERYANLDAQVFAPHGRTTMYLVTAGGRMTREDALQARSRALRMGMPRDTYIQNYKE